MEYILIVAGMLVCALMAIRASRLLFSAIWLAAASALVALLMFMLGAPEVAVIELSVGAGLVTVLFVFAINIAGEEGTNLISTLPKPLTWISIFVFLILVGYFLIPFFSGSLPSGEASSLSTMLWENRSLDVALLTVLIFAGVLSIIGLISDETHQTSQENNA